MIAGLLLCVLCDDAFADQNIELLSAARAQFATEADPGWHPLLSIADLEPSAEAQCLIDVQQVRPESAEAIGSAMESLGIRRLTLTGKLDTTALPLLRKNLIALDLDSCLWSESVGPAIASLAELEVLTLSRTAVADDDVRQLRSCKSLRALDLRECTGVSSAGLVVVRDLPLLYELCLAGVPLGDLTEEVSSVLAGFAVVDLRGTGLPESTLAALRRRMSPDAVLMTGTYVSAADQSAAMSRLTDLRVVFTSDRYLHQWAGLFRRGPLPGEFERAHWFDIAFGKTTDPAVLDEKLTLLHKLNRVRGLYIAGSGAGDGHARNLASLTELEGLGMSECQITDVGVGELRTLKKLRLLALAGNRVTDATAPIFADLPELRALFLGGTSITDGGLVHIGRCRSLVTLDLSETGITDAGLVHLKDLQLSRLNLSSTRVSPEGLRHIQHMDSLSTVDIRGTGITEADMSAAGIRWPRYCHAFTD